MFAITTSPTWFTKTDDFKKVGKKIQKQRSSEVERIKDKIGDIARDEQRRVKEIFKEHQDIVKKAKGSNKKTKNKTKPKSIDLYEK
jgi:hypothetical protein